MTDHKSITLETVDAAQFIKERGLRTIEPFLLGRLGVSRVLDSDNHPYVLKTDKIPPDQIALLTTPLPVGINAFIRFPYVEAVGITSAEQKATWVLMEDVQGKKEADLIDTDPQFCIDKNWEIAQAYQTVIARYSQQEPLAVDAAASFAWLFDRLEKWSAKIIEAQLITAADVARIKAIWDKLIAENGNRLIATVHGNIHGDHVIFPEQGPSVILDPVIWVRPGRSEYYDWLRSLDWMILKSRQPEAMMNLVIKNIRQRLNHIPEEELRAFIALRAIGCLGADILGNMDIPPSERENERKNCFISLIQSRFSLT